MKKYLLSAGVIIIIAAYAFYQHINSQAPASAPSVSATSQIQTPNPAPSAGNNPPVGNPAAASSSATATGQTTAAVAGQFKDGTYTGSVADAFYGQLQAVVVIQNGKITDVQFPLYPNTPGHTTDVSNEALPQLKSEAIAAQSANVQIVSGATQDSQAFQQSLQSALAQAE